MIYTDLGKHLGVSIASSIRVRYNILMNSNICAGNEHCEKGEARKRNGTALRTNKETLGFPPASKDLDMFEVSVYDGKNDDRLFYRRKDLESIEKEQAMKGESEYDNLQYKGCYPMRYSKSLGSCIGS